MSIGELSVILLVGMTGRPVRLVIFRLVVVSVLMGWRGWLVVREYVVCWLFSLSIEVLRRRFAFLVLRSCLFGGCRASVGRA